MDVTTAVHRSANRFAPYNVMRLSRWTKAEYQFAAGMAILIGCACAPAPARPTPLDFSGEWTGSTSQARRIAFTVTPDLRITGIALDFSFNGCAGSLSLPADVALLNTTGTAAAAFTHAPNGPTGPDRTSIHFLFPSIASANGTIDFNDYAGCGSTTATFNASKR